jgi:hypothetical protein
MFLKLTSTLFVYKIIYFLMFEWGGKRFARRQRSRKRRPALGGSGPLPGTLFAVTQP